MRMRHLISEIVLSLVMGLFFLLSACSPTFNFTGGNVDSRLETLAVDQFLNEAPIIVPALAQDFTQALQDRFLSQSRLSLTTDNADIFISGVITGYRVDYVAIQGDDRAAQNRLTISARVKFENNVDENDSWEQTFNTFVDFNADDDFTSVEPTLIEEIIEQLTQDIFNKSIGKW